MRGVVAALEIVWRAGRWHSAVLVAATVVAATVPVLTAWLTKLVIDLLTGEGALAQVLPLALGLAVAGLAIAVSQEVRTYSTTELSRRVGVLAQARLYRAVNRLPGLARLENPAFLDRLRLAAQAGGKTPAQIVEAGLELAAGAITILGFLGSLLVISPVMAMAVLAGALPALMAEIALSRRRAAMLWRIGPVERRELVYSDLMSSVTAAKETRLFGLGGFLHGRMMTERQTANAEERRIDRRTLAVQTLLGVVSALISGAGLVWAIAQASSGVLTPGDVALFIAAVAGVQSSLGTLVTQVALAHHELLMFAHYRHVVTVEPEMPVGALPPPPPPGAIEFRDVWFRYGPEHPWVLRGVSLTVPFGGSTGLVGKNGAGKSTLVKLLCRFYDPTHGAILWNGVDLRDVDPELLRERITTVFQDFMVYEMTAGENIGLGELSLLEDRSAITTAAENAGADSMLRELPRGYDSLVTRSFFQDGEESEGVYLSGGQGQRVAIARALLRGERDLVILDEPSSGLDAEAEYEVHSRLRHLRRGQASLLISHRLGVVRDADRLLVLEDGAITEEGTHDELMSTQGVYAHLFSLQASGYQK
ncbi:ABC transporter ATP-binding protein [Spiractinospora alimapuensis]|uniref:ABC transporter ATP-binding protein n=1 Tax=Spiractinospora alimapuensis TaxID=2820884 RepID=UPI001F40DD02|nr:ABC transporter ATP-binding protein [Spiractinospora alimapuensis]QVQ52445.1 ABC transporter ATP-binding protein [Spiractinospora alimapuensis]